MIDARVSRRRRVLKGAQIQLGEGFGTIPCAVKDLSEHGCRLQLEQLVALPKAFRLVIELDGLEFTCQPVWRKAHVVGVAFLGAPRKVNPARTQVLDRHVKPAPHSAKRPAGAPRL
jgi:PilZ domain